ncbi:hypothetical protein CTEN210_09866 [Chaetoceros tenuissimus]|uniref:F-box domain-containing protein n=1 Tax=Chaetoceros tenuissimus TaxID=426638 RepID=A0AAD3H7M3_9STRA|nr:hypothetical protein CTEN210_09866 [Chaetoceros tenuissimus]
MGICQSSSSFLEEEEELHCEDHVSSKREIYRTNEKEKTRIQFPKRSYRNHCFHKFGMLSDDVILEILSYLTEAPFEQRDEVKSPLTHVLPLVNHQFNVICKSNTVWMASMQRLSFRDPDRVKYSFKQCLNTGFTKPTWSVYYNQEIDKDDYLLAHNVHNMHTLSKQQVFELVSKIYDSIQSQSHKNKEEEEEEEKSQHSTINTQTKSNEITSVRELYFSIAKDFATISYPIFHMRFDEIQVGMIRSIMLFEPRYKHMIQELMQDRKPVEMRSGKTLKEPRPRFLFCHTVEIGANRDAYLVEIQRCRRAEFGRYNVLICVLRKVRMIKVEARDDGLDHSLKYAEVRRM